MNWTLSYFTCFPKICADLSLTLYWWNYPIRNRLAKTWFSLIMENKIPCVFLYFPCVISVFNAYHNILNLKRHFIDVTQQFFLPLFTWYWISLFKFSKICNFPAFSLSGIAFHHFPCFACFPYGVGTLKKCYTSVPVFTLAKSFREYQPWNLLTEQSDSPT